MRGKGIGMERVAESENQVRGRGGRKEIESDRESDRNTAKEKEKERGIKIPSSRAGGTSRPTVVAGAGGVPPAGSRLSRRVVPRARCMFGGDVCLRRGTRRCIDQIQEDVIRQPTAFAILACVCLLCFSSSPSCIFLFLFPLFPSLWAAPPSFSPSQRWPAGSQPDTSANSSDILRQLPSPSACLLTCCLLVCLLN